MGVQFRLLGTVEAAADGRLIDVGHARQQCVLVSLLVDVNRAVTADQLVDRVWGEGRLPARPRSAVQTYVSLLRRALARVAGVTITRRATGYVLGADPSTVDLHRFLQLLAEASGQAGTDRAAALLAQAIGLWRGPVFAALDTPWLDTVRATLHRQHRAAQSDLIDLRLARGEHAGLLPTLADLADEYPLDERVAGQLILALSRSGRQADGLAHYQQLRGRLRDDLGADVGAPLRELHHQILAATPAAASGAPRPGAARPSAPRPNAPRPNAPRPNAPRQLPAGPRLLTGRKAELAALDAALCPHPASGAMAMATIGGPGGVGKTCLALRWAHEHAALFPDGQLYVNLRGFDAEESLPPGVVLRGFLDALGLEPGAIPVNADAQASLYRSVVADRRVLVVLDNARDTAQVVPLLPAGPSCAVLVTSRHRLDGLVTGYRPHAVDLGMFTVAEARELLVEQLGRDRVDAEPGAVADLLASCAGLPLALCVVAARVAANPSFPLAVLAGELRAASTRLAALETADLTASVRAVLSWSDRALDPDRSRAFGLLGIAPGPDISLAAAASLTAQPAAQAARVLRDLEAAYLLEQHVPGRYRMHDLTRLYAAEQAERELPDEVRTAALRRLAGHYLLTAAAGQQLLDPHPTLVQPAPPEPGCQPYPLADRQAALAWFVAEHQCLLATHRMMADLAWHLPAWELAWVLDTFHRLRGRLDDQVACWLRGLAAAGHLGDPRPQVYSHRFAGVALARAGRQEEALDHLYRALELAEAAGDQLNLAHSHRALAPARGQRGDHEQALHHATCALTYYQENDEPRWHSDTLNMMGWYAAQLGRYQQARQHCEASLALARRNRTPMCEANALDSLGYIAHQTGRPAEAVDRFQQAVALWQGCGDAYEEADTLDRLGHSQAALGCRPEASHAWRQALDLYEAQHRSADAERVRDRLAALDRREEPGRQR